MLELFDRAKQYFTENPSLQPAWRDQAKQAIIDAVVNGTCTTISMEEANGDADTFWEAYLASRPQPETPVGEDN